MCETQQAAGECVCGCEHQQQKKTKRRNTGKQPKVEEEAGFQYVLVRAVNTSFLRQNMCCKHINKSEIQLDFFIRTLQYLTPSHRDTCDELQVKSEFFTLNLLRLNSFKECFVKVFVTHKPFQFIYFFYFKTYKRL